MIVNVKGRFEIVVKFSLLFLFVFLQNACTPANPQFGFDFSSEKVASSLNLKTDVEALNISNNAKVTIYGSCNEKSTFKLSSPIVQELKCNAGSFSQALDLASLPDGNVEIKIDEKDVFGDATSQQKTLIKDMLAPSVTVVQPADIGSGTSTINLSGSCSEESREVQVFESSTGFTQTVKCSSAVWNMLFDLGSDLGINNFQFKAKHSDTGLNTSQATTATVNRVVIGDYSISGVSMTSGGSYTSTLKGNFNYFWVKWTAAVNVTKFDLTIYELNPNTSQYDISICNRSSLSGSSTDVSLTGCNLSAGGSFQVKMVATNTLLQQVVRTLNFVTKALPRLRLDAKKLFVAAGFDNVAATDIPYSEIIDNYDVNDGPFTVTLSGVSAGLTGYWLNDNSNQKIIISPGTSRVSGIFSFSIQITDAYSNVSVVDSGKFILAMPFSWAGLIDNDFNKAGNWCGSVSLHAGCQGSGTAPSFNAKVMIDDLCESPIANTSSTNCNPVLSANTNVHSFFMRQKTFDQNGKSLTVGDVTGPTFGDFNRSNSFFKQLGGVFNSSSPSSSGDLFILNRFFQDGGVFYSPYLSNFTISSMHTNTSTNVASIANKSFFFHNNSNMIFIDPQGISGNVYFDAPAGTELFNVKFVTSGASWAFRSDNLIVNGDLEIGGAIYGGNYPKLNGYYATNKMTLKGNLKCTGVNKGGSLPIYIDSAANSKYLVSHADCKFPPLYLANSSSSMTEDAASVYDAVFERLVITTGNSFQAPSSSRKIIINSEFSETSSQAFSNSGGFDANNGIIEFQNLGDGAKEFSISSSSALNKVSFVNNSTAGNFYKLASDLNVKELTFSGSHSVNLRGNGLSVTTQELTFNKGLTGDPNVLSRIALAATGTTLLTSNTSDRINIQYLDIGRDIFLTGSSLLLDLSGANINLNSFYFSVPSNYVLDYNTYNATTGSINNMGGTVNSNSL